MRLSRGCLLALVAAIAGVAAPLAAPALALDDDADRGGYETGDGAPQRNVPGQFDYYALVLSWSPTYCSEKDNDDNYELQCDRQDGRRYSFVLHGLWPQYERGYPERCWTRRKPYVPEPLIDRMLDIMPSPKLVIHEYKKHGTCSGLDPAGYFDTSRKMFRKVRIPERYENPFEKLFVSPDEIEQEFIDENPGLTPEMIAVSCGGAGNRLREVRICFTKEGAFRSCGANEQQRRLCNAPSMFVPPVRSRKMDPDTDEDIARAKGSKIPRPGVMEGVTGR